MPMLVGVVNKELALSWSFFFLRTSSLINPRNLILGSSNAEIRDSSFLIFFKNIISFFNIIYILRPCIIWLYTFLNIGKRFADAYKNSCDMESLPVMTKLSGDSTDGSLTRIFFY